MSLSINPREKKYIGRARAAWSFFPFDIGSSGVFLFEEGLALAFGLLLPPPPAARPPE